MPLYSPRTASGRTSTVAENLKPSSSSSVSSKWISGRSMGRTSVSTTACEYQPGVAPEGLHVDVVAPEAVLDHPPWRLAGTETGNPDLLAQFPDLRLDTPPDGLRGHLDVEPDLVLLEFRYVSRHTLQFLLSGPPRAAMCERRDLNPHAVRH